MRPILEDDLHAYVDGALDDGRRAEVQAYLESHAESATRVAGYIQQRAALRAALAPIAAEPIPPELSLRHLMEARRPSRSVPWRMAAAAVVLLALGGAGGWSLRGPASEPMMQHGIAGLAQEAAYTYDVYGADQAHPVEFKAADKAQLVDWISSRIQRNISVPDLTTAGYRFMGGRLVATPYGPAGLLMYDNGQGVRLGMLVRPMTIDKTARMVEHTDGGVNGYAWADKGLGYSLVGSTSSDILHPLANEMRRQINDSI
ncbi:anti-sigma factor [Acidisoma cellulosilytica]|uniref:Anti-sigma factor n=1 Tax=Acidisoma cellulosilyticum TaxID=2802395 RepID=A0A964E2W6_9PROT|nr:anti-sigma factor [Acidisoma cellulosilyticum]MCB8879841.1 anti-sigma factor [Acidisoma cellulosilyticum]